MGHSRPARSDQGLTSDVASPSEHAPRGFKAREPLVRPIEITSTTGPLKAFGFPDPRRLPSARSSCEPFSGHVAARATSRVSAPFHSWRDDRSELGPVPRSQPRPRAAFRTRRR
jgi:hypothetical protein